MLLRLGNSCQQLLLRQDRYPKLLRLRQLTARFLARQQKVSLVTDAAGYLPAPFLYACLGLNAAHGRQRSGNHKRFPREGLRIRCVLGLALRHGQFDAQLGERLDQRPVRLQREVVDDRVGDFRPDPFDFAERLHVPRP